jgi:hypothetical protein
VRLSGKREGRKKDLLRGRKGGGPGEEGALWRRFETWDVQVKML